MTLHTVEKLAPGFFSGRAPLSRILPAHPRWQQRGGLSNGSPGECVAGRPDNGFARSCKPSTAPSASFRTRRRGRAARWPVMERAKAAKWSMDGKLMSSERKMRGGRGQEPGLQSTYASTLSIRDAGEGRNPRSISASRASYSPARSRRRFSVNGSAPFARRLQRSACSFRNSGVMAASVGGKP
jgi:hypothetical protein